MRFIFLDDPKATFLPILLLVLNILFLDIGDEYLTALLLGLHFLPVKSLVVLLSLNLDLVALIVEIVQLKNKILLALQHLFQNLTS
jgi:hypothetical protein